eukprot:CAMPEP_0172442048 /NCGR_PEP_ID=MMETSP1065-20121228/2519_1 /TAXON_ID=265537 /ORGANISM="Amphiprora paludosa, Strain CCMP125" /LENGTH=1289 /DNA_ID=CAMNT_0013191709 /DNA_START=35 /DNA_END=3904 /DNA_ORIENTATION=+
MTLEEKRRKRRLEIQRQNEERRRQILMSQAASTTVTREATVAAASREGSIGTKPKPESCPNENPFQSALVGKQTQKCASSRAKTETSGGWLHTTDKTKRKNTTSDDKKLMPVEISHEQQGQGTPIKKKNLPSSHGLGKKTSPSVSSSLLFSSDFASPQSSVTFSQDPTRSSQRDTVPTKMGQSESINPNNKEVDDFRLGSPESLPKSRRPRRRSSSSSDDSIDLIALSKIKEAGSMKDDQKSSRSDPPLEVVSKKPEKSVSQSPVLDQRPSDDSPHSSSDEESPDKNAKRRGVTKNARNPLNRMKDDMAPTKGSISGDKLKDAACALDGDIVDQMWADPIASEEEDEKSSSGKRKAKKSRKSSDQGGRERNYSMNCPLAGLDLEANSGKNDDEIRAERKPNMTHPQFSGADEPLVLEMDQRIDNSCDAGHQYEVPASMARYLGEYQKRGVEFLFQSISMHKGAILGDDMGLGKTVQTVALVAALLGKTGTGEDLLSIQQRMCEFAERKKKKQDAELEALRNGAVYTEPVTDEEPLVKSQWFPILVVAPSSVLSNWVTDFNFWGYFAIALYNNDDSYAGIESVIGGLAEVLIVSHSSLADRSRFQKLLSVRWKLVVIDEFHIFKNDKSKWSKNTRLLKEKHESSIIGLTGTVMQNNHAELWNLHDMVVPGILGNWNDFEKRISKPIMLSRTKDATDEAIEIGRRCTEELNEKLHQIYLRRTKEAELKDSLPKKDERIVFCEPSHLQKEIYQHILKQPDSLLVRFGHFPCDCGVNNDFFEKIRMLSSKEEKLKYYRVHKQEICPRSKCCYSIPVMPGGGSRIDARAVLWLQQHPDQGECQNCPWCIGFPLMHVLHKICTHVSLLQPEHHPNEFPLDHKKRVDAERALKVAKQFIPEHIVSKLPGASLIRQDSIMNDHAALSGKMKVLEKLLKRIQQQDGRVLVFSAYTTTLDLIQSFVETNGYSFLRMDGSTSPKNRKEIADRFRDNSDIFIFLLSTKAMGLGLNLTSASWVIIFDVEWNPSYDAQAQDRSYRIGQTKDVKVFRLVCRGSIEELRYLRQLYKNQLKSETIIENMEAEREETKRTFRAVDKDKNRRGELFGYVNLLRFNPNSTFMDYGLEAPEAKHYHLGCYDMRSFLQAADTATEDNFDEDDINKLVGRKSHEKATTTEDKGKSQLVAGESQAGVEFCDAIPVASKTATIVGTQDNLVDAAAASPNQTVVQTSTASTGLKTRKAEREADVSLEDQMQSKRKPVTRENRHEAAKRNRKKKDKTTFSAFDLALPSGVRKKRRK